MTLDKQLTKLSLFTGIGGDDLASEWAGIKTACFVEKDKYCQKVLRKHWPDTPIIEDVKDVTKEKIMAYAQDWQQQEQSAGDNGCEGKRETQERPVVGAGCGSVSGDIAEGTTVGRRVTAPVPTGGEPHAKISVGNSGTARTHNSFRNGWAQGYGIDIISGGFPCQPHSVAGKRKGTGDERNLWPEFRRIIGEIKPRWVVPENVPGIFASDGGLFFNGILCDLAQMGYSVGWCTYGAVDVGALHRRDRVFIVAYSQHAGGRTPPSRADGIGQKANQRADRFTQFGVGGCGQDVADTHRERPQGHGGLPECGGQWFTWQGSQPFKGIWQPEPNVGRSPDGFPLWLYRHSGRGLSYEESLRRCEVLRKLWNPNAAKALWYATRGYDRMEQAQILFAFVRQYETSPNKARLLLESSEALVGFVFGLYEQGKLASPPLRPEDSEQWCREHSDSMQELSRLLAYDGQPDWQISSWEDALPRVATGVKHRMDRLKCLGNAVVPQQIYPIYKAIVDVDTGQ